jgi:hypothetical protein
MAVAFEVPEQLLGFQWTGRGNFFLIKNFKQRALGDSPMVKGFHRSAQIGHASHSHSTGLAYSCAFHSPLLSVSARSTGRGHLVAVHKIQLGQ